MTRQESASYVVEESEASRTGRKFQDPFQGYFERGQQKGRTGTDLLDHHAARAWLRVIRWGMETGLYGYQQPFEEKAAPRIALDGENYLMLSSYDYLGLIGHPEVESAAIAAIRQFGTGTGGVRLLTGTTTLHQEFETELAAFKGTEAAMTFTSGYMANLGVISSLLGPGDSVILDSRAHRSIVDACRLARVQVRRFSHNDPCSLASELQKEARGKRTLIVVEGIYSMDGDICPLAEIVALKRKENAFLMVDEAHSFGTLGISGKGVDQYFGISPDAVDIWMGSLSKAIPSNGGFIAGARDLIIYMQHGAAAFMFSAALSPPAVGSARASLQVLQREPQRIVALRRNAAYLRSGLIRLGFDIGNTDSQVIPVIVGSDERAYRLSHALFMQGVIALGIVSPAVPVGKARLRLCATAAQDRRFLDEVLAAFRVVRDAGWDEPAPLSP